jgi:hypothetical protein
VSTPTTPARRRSTRATPTSGRRRSSPTEVYSCRGCDLELDGLTIETGVRQVSINYTPRTWVAGEVVTAAFMNTEVRDALTGIQAAWTVYTPTWTASHEQPDAGQRHDRGALPAGRQAHRLLDQADARLDDRRSAPGTTGFTLPVAPFASHPCAFDVRMSDASTGGVYRGVSYSVSGSTILLAVDNGTAGGPLQQFTAAVPVVPAVSDAIAISAATYEAA